MSRLEQPGAVVSRVGIREEAVSHKLFRGKCDDLFELILDTANHRKK